MATARKGATERSKVQHAGRTVSDAEILLPEHDDLVIALRSVIAQVCEVLFGLAQERIEEIEQRFLRDTRELVGSALTPLEKLVASGFTYAAWMTKADAREHPELAKSRPSKAVHDAALAAIQVLKHLRLQSISLEAATSVVVEEVTMQAQLTDTSYDRSSNRKIADLGYVDLRVKYHKPPGWFSPSLVTDGKAIHLGSIGHVTDEDSLLETLAQVTPGTVIGYAGDEFRTWNSGVALFTVRTGTWTLMEIIQEMRNLKKSDQGDQADVVFVAPAISSQQKSLLHQEGFYALDASDLASLSER